MKIKIKDIKPCKKLLEIEIENDALNKEFDNALKDVKNVAQIAGFRKGKVPVELVKKHFKDEINQELIKRLIQSSYFEAIESKGIAVVSMPNIYDVDFAENKKLSYKAEVFTRPEVTVSKYKGLELTRIGTAVTEKEIEEAISRLLEISATYLSVERPAQKGDYLITDLNITIEGKEPKSFKNKWISLNDENPLKELVESLIGLAKNGEKTVEVALPQMPDENQPLEKKTKAVYEVKIKEVKEKKLPLLDENFAKKLGKSSVEDLKEIVRKEIEASKDKGNFEKMKQQIYENLLKNTGDFEVPENLLSGYTENYRKNMEDRFVQEGLDLSKAKELINANNDKITENSLRKVRLFFIINKIAETENIKVAEEELDYVVSNIAGNDPKKIEQVRKYYEERGLFQELEEQILEDKVINFLIENSNVKTAEVQ